jgi:uncharacterized protein YcaQ
MRVLSPELVRRLNITRQRLAGPRPAATPQTILDAVRDLGCLQLDPISAVARSHLLVLHSRFGKYDPAHLDTLLWQERCLFEYWAHAASIVLTEDYPIHQLNMQQHLTGDSAWHRHIRAWMKENAALRDYILTELRSKGPLPSKHFEDKAADGWQSTGWTSGRNVSRMLDFLWISGTIMVAGRKGGQKLWDLSERCLPDWTPRDPMPQRELVKQAAQKSLRALGVAQERHIRQHYVSGRYPDLPGVLKALEAEKRIERVQIKDDERTWPGIWYIHTEDLPLLDQLSNGLWQPRTTLLSPFDNLIRDRARTEGLFNFFYRIEIYVPKARREYGYYVLPILHGDRLIGRIDPLMDRKNKRLAINAVYAEADAPKNLKTGKAVAAAIEELASFLQAKEIVYGERKPEGWRRALQ